MSKLVHLRIPTSLYEDAKRLATPAGFSSVQDFVRDAIRKNVEGYQRELITKRLATLQGTKKGSPNQLSEKEYDLLLKQLLNTSSSEFLRKHNLEGVPVAGKVRNVASNKK